MLGTTSVQYYYNKNVQRQKMDSSNLEDKERKKREKMTFLINKYFNKITQTVLKEIHKNKNKAVFYFNYYDFLNDKLGHPQLLMKQLMYELSYEYSEFPCYDEHGNTITLKTLFGNSLTFELKGKNSVVIKW